LITAAGLFEPVEHVGIDPEMNVPLGGRQALDRLVLVERRMQVVGIVVL
jgi:hypothetical protein